MKVCFTFKFDKLTRINLLLRIHYIFENTVALCDLNDLTICRRCFTLVFYLKLHSYVLFQRGRYVHAPALLFSSSGPGLGSMQRVCLLLIGLKLLCR